MHYLTSEEVRAMLPRQPDRKAFYRIRTNPALEFPKAIVISGRPLWEAHEVLTWIASRPRVTALPPRRRKRPSRAATILTDTREAA